MNKFSLVKNSTVILSSIIILSSLSPSLAEAATTYKIKSGKLVVAKSNKVVKGYKLYKNTLYYNGKKRTATTVYKNILYVKGKKATGTKLYKKTLYVSGKKSKGNKVYKSTLYVNGKKSTGYKLASGTLYNKGKKVKGYKAYSGKLYNNGKIATGYKSSGGILYYNGVKFLGTYNSKYYKTGKVYTGTVGKYYYSKGVKLTGLNKNGALYVKGVLNVGQYVYDSTLYKGAYPDGSQVVYNGTQTAYKGKLFSGSKLATGVFKVDGKDVEFVNGLPKSDTGTPTDETPVPGTDPTTLTNAQIIELINSYYQTTITPNNMEYISKLIEAYSKLTLSEQNMLKEKVQSLQKSLDQFKADLNLTSEEINSKAIYTEIDSKNVDEAKKILAAYNSLSERDKANVTYPMAKLKTMVDVFTIKNSGITEVNALNAKEVSELITLYKGLSPEDQAPLKSIVDILENKLNLFIKTSGTSFVIVTDDNYTAALEALTAALKLSVEEQQKLNFSVTELKSKIDAYQFNQNTTYTIINNDLEWSQALTIINKYEGLPATTRVYINYNIEELKKVIKVYEFSLVVKTLNVSTVDGAKQFINAYNALPQDIRSRIETTYKDKLETAKLTVDVDDLQKLLNSAMTLNITPTSSLENVNTAKDAIITYDNAPSKVVSRVTANISGLKESVAGYDFVKYYNNVVNPATKSLNGSVYIKSSNFEIARKEFVYIARMYTLMSPELQADYRTDLDVRFGAHKVSLDPNLSISISTPYKIENLDSDRYADITYKFEKEFKYTESVELVKKLGN
ncbi:MAG: hypothetical protein KBT36_02255 [Kurthia sp.]|nr:hypothetical protein [Candidatus Kurthia equi]